MDTPPTSPHSAHSSPLPHAAPSFVAARRGRRPRIVAIGGGKGGIGKSLISSNLAFLLGQKGQHVTLFDADLGGANAHTCLGLPAPKKTVADFVSRRVQSLGEVAVKTPFDNLELISGALDWMQAANPRPHEKARLGEALLSLQTDVLIIDLGAGTSLHTIDFFLLADHGIVATLPEPTAVENAYRFIKMACIRRLQALELSWHSRPILGRILDDRAFRGLLSPAELLGEVFRHDAALATRLKQELERHPMALVVNQVRDDEEQRLVRSMAEACHHFFGVQINATLSIPYDDGAWRAVRRRRPVAADEPHGPVASRIRELSFLFDGQS